MYRQISCVKFVIILVLMGLMGFRWAQGQVVRRNLDRLDPVSMTFSIQPIGKMTLPHVDQFELERVTVSGVEKEHIRYDRFWFPGANLGISINTAIAYFDIIGGWGFFINEDLYGACRQGTFSIRFKVGGPFITLGPRIGLMRLYNIAHQDSDVRNDVDFDGITLGFVGGELTIGGRRGGFFVSTDWFKGETDVYTSNGWVITEDADGIKTVPTTKGKLDMSGLRWQIGFILRF